MQKLKILNTRDIKKIKDQIISQFGYFPEEDYAYLQTEKDKIFIISKDLAKVDLSKLIIDRVGLYFAEINNNDIRLSKEGAQLLAQEAKKNKIELKNLISLTKEEVKKYFQGSDLEKDCGSQNRLVLLEYQENIFGCAKYKEKKIINFLPKIHRGEVIL